MERFGEEEGVQARFADASAVFDRLSPEPQRPSNSGKPQFATWRSIDIDSGITRAKRKATANLTCTIITGVGMTLIAYSLWMRMPVATAAIIIFGVVSVLIPYVLVLAIVDGIEWNRLKARVDPGEFRVELVLWKNDACYAHDFGNLSIRDGYLLYESANTTFSFSREVVSLCWNEPSFDAFRERLRYGKRPEVRFRFMADETWYEIGFNSGSTSAELEVECREAISNWLKEGIGVHGYSVFPPKGTTRGELRRARIDASTALGYGIAGACFLGAGVMNAMHEGDLVRSIIFGTNPLLMLLGACIPLGICVLVFSFWLPFGRARRRVRTLESELKNSDKVC